MPQITLPPGVLNFSIITVQDICDFSWGHCFGLDGGSGIPNNLKVIEGRGGTFEVWTLNTGGTKVIAKEYYSRCQYCLKYYYAGQVEKT